MAKRGGGPKGGLPVVLGGKALHEREWPSWPRAGIAAQRALLDVLHSDCWTSSAMSWRGERYERAFGEAFAAYCGRAYGVPCASGTAALTIGLQALGLGPGDEVIVPGLTWVACASAVVAVGAVPVLVDSDPNTLCPTLQQVQAAITPRTRAVLGVHMYASQAPIEALESLCSEMGLALIEDASQAHGGMAAGRRLGQFGRLSVFSFQQTKLLTSGEGGIVLTDDPALYRTLQQLRADGRIYGEAPEPPLPNFHNLKEVGEVMGRNLCLTEFQAAILLEGLNRLDRENHHRRVNAERLEEALNSLEGVSLVWDRSVPPDGRTFYKIPLRFDHPELVAIGPQALSAVLTADLNLPVKPLDVPLSKAPLYRPESLPLVSRHPALLQAIQAARNALPVAEEQWQRCLALPHPCLLGGDEELSAVVSAVERLITHRHALLDALGPFKSGEAAL